MAIDFKGTGLLFGVVAAGTVLYGLARRHALGETLTAAVLLGIVPAIVPAPPPEPFAVQVIIVDWLYREVDGLAEIKMPVLQHIAGHRNREVYEYLEFTHDVRDSRAAAIYSA
jgi:hypothetical protein